jgi:uncharacterized protein
MIIAFLFFLLMLLTIVGLTLSVIVTNKLKKSCPEEYVKLGSPSLFTNNSIKNGWLFGKFLLSRSYKKLGCKVLTRLCSIMFVNVVLYYFLFVIFLVLCFSNVVQRGSVYSWYKEADSKFTQNVSGFFNGVFGTDERILSKREKFVAKLTGEAESGDVKAQYELGNFYAYAAKDDKEKQLAIKWLQKAVDGYVIAAYNDLAVEYMKGDLVKKDLVKSRELYKQGAELGDQVGMFNIGLYYFYGAGGEQDYKQAFIWFSKAAFSNEAASQYMLFKMYFNGLGVTKDEAIARNWLNLVAHSFLDKEFDIADMDIRNATIDAFITYQLALAQKVQPKYKSNVSSLMIKRVLDVSHYLDETCTIGVSVPPPGEL